LASVLDVGSQVKGLSLIFGLCLSKATLVQITNAFEAKLLLCEITLMFLATEV